jgi:haloacetate dehalogenase
VGHLWDVKAGWEKYSHRLQAYGIPKCGHFVPEEQPGVVLSKLTSFLEDVSAGRI